MPNRLYTIDFLSNKLKISLSQLDSEMRSGNIEKIGDKYRLNKEYGQSSMQQLKVVPESKLERRATSTIGRYVNRKCH